MTTCRPEDFIVLKQLRVHNITVEGKRIKAVYEAVHPDGSSEQTELIYSYDNRVFEPGDAASINLASVMLAQVALNYGLFCRELIFDGLFDARDQSFLEDMLENTSREIIVHKLWADNPFLLPEFRGLQIDEKRTVYTRAKVTFLNTKFSGMKAVRTERTPDRNAYAISSSGGKDSLLSYGLLRELGEAHAIYINEAGRHWYTAVNAHRYMKEADPNTAKPWCNSDRVFSWMLRQLPFIRRDFASVRADIYPVRLWTVAVFTFGLLPIVLKRNIGHLVVGNEYDTTMRGNVRGLTHYYGLYDQSKYFDNALTRYYKQKGWNIYQHSLLRSLSELLILKVLVKRYPDLQAQQVSCHASHERDGRMYPCGKCEKCRRIIGMLIALDEDPQRCGYSPEQITAGLRALERQAVKQIGSDAAHLYHLLLEKGAIADNDHTRKLAKAYPRIMALRFDAERSNLQDMPEALRAPLFAILAEYAEGVAEFRDKAWQTIPEGTIPGMDRPYVNA